MTYLNFLKNKVIVVTGAVILFALLITIGVKIFNSAAPKLQPEKIALRIAWEAVMKTDRYRYWKEQGEEYKATAHPTYAKNAPEYKPELWTVDFDLPNVEDQNMYVDVNINTGKVLYLHEYQA